MNIKLEGISRKLKLGEQLPRIQEQITRISEDKNKLILAAAVVAIILFLDLSFVLKSQTRALGAVRSKLTKLRNDLGNLNTDLIRMQRQEKGLVVEQAKNIVSPDQMPWVIEEISRLANQQEVKIFQIKPVREPLPGKTPRKSGKTDEHTPFLIDLVASAGYHQLGRFLSALENHPVFLKVEELDIGQSDENIFVHKIKLRLKTYVSE